MAGGARRNSGAKIIPMEIKKAKGTYRKERDTTNENTYHKCVHLVYLVPKKTY